MLRLVPIHPKMVNRRPKYSKREIHSIRVREQLMMEDKYEKLTGNHCFYKNKVFDWREAEWEKSHPEATIVFERYGDVYDEINH